MLYEDKLYPNKVKKMLKEEVTEDRVMVFTSSSWNHRLALLLL